MGSVQVGNCSIWERKVTQPWESNPGPTPIRGELATLIVSVGCCVAGQEPMRAFFNPSLFPLGGGEERAAGGL